MNVLQKLLGLYTDAGQAIPEAIGSANVRDPLAKLLMGTVEGMATMPRRAMQSSESMRTTGIYDPAPMVEASTLMMGGAPLVSNVSRAGEVALGIVPVDVAKSFGLKKSLPDTEAFRSAVQNTPGARVDDGSLVMNVMRRQRPEQELEQSVRGGVFYLPEGSPAAKFYNTGTKSGAQNNYGGSQLVEGQTALTNPLVVKGATGGRAPEIAMDTLMGKGSYEAMRKDAFKVVMSPPASLGVSKGDFAEEFLKQYAPELSGMGHYIVESSKKGNQLAYALQEAAVASAVRRAGHDGVVGYSVGRGRDKKHTFSELFDVRERSYPSPSGEFDTWPLSAFGK